MQCIDHNGSIFSHQEKQKYPLFIQKHTEVMNGDEHKKSSTIQDLTMNENIFE